jgi:FkbM family methyltransferase
MSITAKLGTACGLLARGEWQIFDRQVRLHWRNSRVRRAGNAPFVHETAGHPLVCFPDLPDSVAQYVQGGDDPWELSLLRTWLQAGDAFIDAGANLGLYSHAIAGHFAGRVRVLALEASPYLVERLGAAARLLGESGLHPVQVAVGADSGEVTFYLARPGCTTVSQSMTLDDTTAADYEPHRMPMRPLGRLAAEHLEGAQPALVKVDVEGAEPLALQGAPPEWLAPSGPLWLIELNLPVLARMKFRPDDVLQYLPATAFERWLLPKYPLAGQPPARPRPWVATEQYADALFYNLIAVPRGPNLDARRNRIAPLFR